MTTITLTRNNYFDVMKSLHDKVFLMPEITVSIIEETNKDDQEFDVGIKKAMKEVEKEGILKRMSALTRKYEKEGKL